jgi:hypothetical protein
MPKRPRSEPQASGVGQEAGVPLEEVIRAAEEAARR